MFFRRETGRIFDFEGNNDQHNWTLTYKLSKGAAQHNGTNYTCKILKIDQLMTISRLVDKSQDISWYFMILHGVKIFWIVKNKFPKMFLSMVWIYR